MTTNSEKASLIQMPEVVMSRILEELDFPAIQTLRKTCHYLRNFIDDLSPDPKIHRTVIFVDTDSIDFKLNFDKSYDFWPNGTMIRIKYEKSEDGEGTLVTWFRNTDRKEKILENQNFLEVFSADFDVIMKNQKSEIQDFILNFEYFPFLHQDFEKVTEKLMPNLISSLKNRPRPLLVRDFYMVAYEKVHILQILPLLDSKSIKRITVTDKKQGQEEKRIWDIEEFLNLEHWKNTKELDIIDVFVKAGIQNFSNFKRIYVGFEDVTMEDVMAWKQLFSAYSNSESFKICFKNNTAESSLLSQFGPPFLNFDQFGLERKTWFFSIQHGLKIAQISFYDAYFRVEKIDDSDVPYGVEIFI